jgi:hypothetical protein
MSLPEKLQRTTEQGLTRQNSRSLQTTLEALKDPKRFNEILSSVPARLEQVIEMPPITALLRSGATITSLEACLAIEIAKASNMLTVGGNLRQGQSLEIAKELIATYPNESLEDFCFCLRNGIKGRYNQDGKLFRFDTVIIHDWVQKYLEEKYKAIEDKLMREKDEYNSRSKVSTDWIQLLQESVKEADKGMVSVNKMSEKEIKEQGQEKPKAHFYPSSSLSEVRQRELHIQWIRENFDARTGQKLETWIPENEWLQKITKKK